MSMFEHALVTGASGFVGSHFLSQLMSDFAKLSISVGGRSAHLAKWPTGPIKYVTLDLSKSVELHSTPDIVFHIAGEAWRKAFCLFE